MRQLAAILFADMAGYTSLMQENEQLARQKRIRLKEILESAIARFNGKIIQYYGDGSMSIFNSAIDGVNCAISIQQQCQQDPKVELRIGLHTGDIIIEEETIYGDGVNLASRIESLAVPGSIFISEKVADEIKNQQNIVAKEMGYFEFKNVNAPIRVFAIANAGLVVPERNELRGKTKQPKNRLAVLPFVNMSADPENEYFSDGITEELLNALTRVDGLQVTSRTSAFAFKGKNDDIRDIAMKLNVDKVLEGSVRKAGSRVRITAQLINAADGYHIWSENYDRSLNDIFEVQDEISNIIANKLRENLVDAAHNLPKTKTQVINVEAYTLYLKGIHYLNKVTPADTKKAIECFEAAIVVEPLYAQAYANAAGAYCYLAAMGQVVPQQAFEKTLQYANKALQIDDTIAEGHTAKGSYHLFYEWKWQAAYEEFKKAIDLNPAATQAYQLLSFYYVVSGQKEKGIKVLEDAVAIDPLSPVINQALANIYVLNERYDDAIRLADKMLEMNPEMRICIELKGWATGMKGDWETALKYFLELHRLTNHPLKGLMGLGFTYTQLGMMDKAMECIRKTEQRQTEEPWAVVDADLAAVWFGIGDLDKTFYHLEQCVKKKTSPISFVIEYPSYKALKENPRFIEWYKTLPEYVNNPM